MTNTKLFRRFLLRGIVLSFAALAAMPLREAVAQSNGFDGIAADLRERAEESSRELAETRVRIESEQVPLTQRLNGLEDELIEARKENDRVNKIRDGRTLDLSNLRAQIKAQTTQNDFLSNLVDEYVRDFESVLHISEAKRYEDTLSDNRNRSLNANLSLEDQTEARMALLRLSLDRLEEAVGGAVFEGSAVDESGVVGDGKFILLGPLAYFAGADPNHVGLADTRLGSNEPVVIDLPGDLDSLISKVAAEGRGSLPIDPTMGNALRVAEIQGTVLDEIKKGGAVMYPLLTLAFFSICVGFGKWIQLTKVQRISPRRFGQIMRSVSEGNREEAQALAGRVRGPIGKMLFSAIEHFDDPRELVEEMLFEQVLHARTRLNSFLPLIKITAAAAPLLGLLGTVSGMINTFKLITLFGTGDASTFSSGISEALITTKWGLIVAIPALLLAAFLTRKARAVVDDMEKVGVSYLNALSKEKANGGGSGMAPSGGNDEATKAPAGKIEPTGKPKRIEFRPPETPDSPPASPEPGTGPVGA